MNNEQTVFVVDDDQAVRDGIKMLVKSVGLNCIDYADAQAFLDDYDESVPGCLVLDIRMPGMGGMELHNRIIELGYCIPVIFLTGHADVPMAVKAMHSGAFNFVEKPPKQQALLDIIQKAIATDSEARNVALNQQQIRSRLDKLTPRGREILGMILDGKVNKEIATTLDLTEKTIEFHRAKMMKHMQVDSIHELIQYALKSGLYQDVISQ